MPTITAANSVLVLSVPGVFTAPQQITGFMADVAFEAEAVEVAETVKGVDGIMSAGAIPFISPMSISVMADSPSSILFENWLAAQKGGTFATFPANGSVSLPSIGRKYTLTFGVLKRIIQMPPAHRVLQGRAFMIDWSDISPASF